MSNDVWLNMLLGSLAPPLVAYSSSFPNPDIAPATFSASSPGTSKSNRTTSSLYGHSIVWVMRSCSLLA